MVFLGKASTNDSCFTSMLVYPRVFYIILHYIPRPSSSLRHSFNTFIFMGRLSVYSNHLLTWNSKDGFDDLLHLGKFWIPEIENDIMPQHNLLL